MFGKRADEGLCALRERPGSIYLVAARAESYAAREPHAVDSVGEGGVVGAGGKYDFITRVGEQGYEAGHVKADMAVRLGPFGMEGASIGGQLESFRALPVLDM